MARLTLWRLSSWIPSSPMTSSLPRNHLLSASYLELNWCARSSCLQPSRPLDPAAPPVSGMRAHLRRGAPVPPDLNPPPVSLHQQHVVPPGTVSTSPTWPGDPYSGTFQEYELTPAGKKLPDPNLGEEEL